MEWKSSARVRNSDNLPISDNTKRSIQPYNGTNIGYNGTNTGNSTGNGFTKSGLPSAASSQGAGDDLFTHGARSRSRPHATDYSSMAAINDSTVSSVPPFSFLDEPPSSFLGPMFVGRSDGE